MSEVMTEGPRIIHDITEALLAAAAQALEARGVEQAAARAASEGYRAHLHTIAVGLSLTAGGAQRRPADEHDQPAPTPGAEVVSPVAQTWARCDLRSESLAAGLGARDSLGRARYGRPLEAHNGRDALRDAREEILDGVHYLTQAILEAPPVEGAPLNALRVARARMGEAWVWLDHAQGLRGAAPRSWGLGAPGPDGLT